MTAKEKKQARKNKRNARIARCRFLKNLLIWFLGVLFLPSIIAVAVFLVPISTYMDLTGQDTSESINPELTSKSLFAALTSIGDYTFSDLPFIISLVESLEDTEISEGSTLGDLVEIDYAKLKTIKLGSSTFTEDLGSCFKVVATMNSVGAGELLGDLDIEAFKTFTAVEDEDKPTLDGNGYIQKDEYGIPTANAKLYYYKVSDVGGNAPYAVVNGEEYKRAFTDDGKLLVAEDITLYYVPLFEAPILDALDLIDEILGNLEVTELLAVAGVELPEGDGEDSIIEKLLGGKTISELGSLGLDGIYVYEVLGGDTTDLIYTVLSQATGKAVEEITFEHLTDGLTVDNILLSTFIGEAQGEIDVLEILSQIVDADGEAPTAETLNVGHLSNINPGKLSIGKILPYKEYEDGVLTKDNSKLYKIILSAIVEDGVSKLPTKIEGEPEVDYDESVQSAAESLTISDFSNIEPNSIKIAEIMTSPNPTFVEILEYTTGKKYDEITVGELAELNPESIALSIFIDAPASIDDPATSVDETQVNKTLYDVLLQSLVIKDEGGNVITNPTYEDIKLNHLNNFNVDKILLNIVMPKTSDNAKLYDILKDITGRNYDAVSINDLKSFNTDKILLNTVMPKTSDNAKLYDILKDITGKNYDAVSINDLKSFNTDDILLNTVLPYDQEKNGKLYAVLKDVTDSEYAQVKLSMLQSFDPLKIKLKTVLEKGDNNILNALLDKDGTLGTMDENVSTLTLYEVYKDTCFTTDKEYTNDLSKKYALSNVDGKDVYTLDADGEYYLNVNAGVWLIMCFDGNAKETEGGVSTVFTESNLTLGDMQASGNKLNERIQNATIRELISAGIIPGVEFNNEEIYHKTFEEFIELAASML